ncbi:zinc finger, CCHC-type containing protein [Tanacetum coccineum]
MGDAVKNMTAKFGKLDKFEGNDFRHWQKKMHFLLTTLKVLYVLSTPMPEFVEDETMEQTRKRCKRENDGYICRGHILNGMSDGLFDVYQTVGSAKELWDQLESKYMTEDASSKKFLVSNFNNYKMVDSRSVMEQYHELLRILGQFTQHEETLRAEESGKGKGKEIVGSSSVNMIEDGKNQNNNKNKKAKERKNDGNNDRSNKKSKLTCWKCGKTTHFKNDCRVKKNNSGNTSSLGQGSKDPNSSQGLNFDFDVLPFNHYVSHIYEICYVHDDAFAWWINSGATYHACKDRCWFDTFHPVQDGYVLHMGDESTKPILGHGNVVLEFSSGKTITLVNVVYVSGLRKNLMSGPMLNKCGYKQVYESDKYILSRHGVFVGFGYYNNGMFMLNLNKVPNAFSSVCMISSKDVDSSMSHSRLGHAHYKRMLVMSKDNLIPEFDITLGKCNTCMLNKITRQTFKDIKQNSNVLELIHSDLCDFHATPSLGIRRIIHVTTAPYTPQQNGMSERKNMAIKEMVNSMLSYSGLSEIFWGDAMLTACYLLNIVPNKRNKVCRAVVRLPEPKRKILGEKEEDPRTFDEVMQSRDVAFWKEAINNEMGSIIENNTWILSDLPPGFRQKEGISYFDTYAPVARISTIRLLIALAATYNLVIHKMDVKTSFLNSELEKEAPKQCHQSDNGCVYCKFDKSDNGVIICLYVDDMLIFGTDQDQVDKTKEFLSSNFSMKDIGEADVIFGIRIKRDDKVSTPLDPTIKLMPNTGRDVDQLEYSRAIGCLMYAMISTRTYIAYVVCKLSSYTSNHSTHHWHAIMRVLKYLKKTMDYGLSYVGFPSVLEGYSNASWITNSEDHTSTIEFVALAAAGKDAKWSRNLIYEILLWPKPISPISIHCDSAANLAKAYCQIYNGKYRHLGVRHSMVHELITNGVISVDFVRSQQNLADHLTKGLARDLMHKSAIGMGLKSIEISNDETPNSLLANVRS